MARLEKILGRDLGPASDAEGPLFVFVLLLGGLLSDSVAPLVLLLCFVFAAFGSAVLPLASLLLLLLLVAVLSVAAAAASVEVMKRAISTSKSLRSLEGSRPLLCSSRLAILSFLQSRGTVKE
jgi:membrane protein implicated in regulation of membrane protease activity